MKYIAHCNNCDILMWDENPQTGQDDTSINVSDLDIDTSTIEHMEVFYDDDSPDGFWGCPACGEDGGLIDITHENYKRLLTFNK